MALSFDAFISRYYPKLEDQYNIMYQLDTDPESLIGVAVTATRSGFSCGNNGGTEMIIDSISDKYIHFAPMVKDPQSANRGWSCDREELPFSVKLTNPEEMAIKWLKLKKQNELA